MMTAISDNGQHTREGELYGIEVEVENLNLKLMPPAFSYWRHVEDGSLRGASLEFQSTPLPPEHFGPALAEVYKARAFWQPSVRTGIHVHVNMLGRSLEQVRNLFLYYLYTEPLFYRMCGTDREHNIYCVPMYRQPDEVSLLWRALQGKNELRSAAPRMCKYVGLYLEPLKRFGTLEFRMAPTWPHADTMLYWLDTIKRLTAPDSITSTVHPHRMYAEIGVEGMIEAIWPDWRDRFNLTSAQLKVIYNQTQADEVALSTQDAGPIEAPWGRPGSYEPQGDPMPPPTDEEKALYIGVHEVPFWGQPQTVPRPRTRDGGMVYAFNPVEVVVQRGVQLTDAQVRDMMPRQAARVVARRGVAVREWYDAPPPPPPDPGPVMPEPEDFPDFDDEENT